MNTMSVAGLIDAVTDMFSTAMNQPRSRVLRHLNQNAARRLSHILDKYSRYMPSDYPSGRLAIVRQDCGPTVCSVLVALVTPDGQVPAFKIRYEVGDLDVVST